MRLACRGKAPSMEVSTVICRCSAKSGAQKYEFGEKLWPKGSEMDRKGHQKPPKCRQHGANMGTFFDALDFLEM